jgi:hypothetical protein
VERGEQTDDWVDPILRGTWSPPRPKIVGNPNSGPQTPAACFKTAAFALLSLKKFGTAGRNVFLGPVAGHIRSAPKGLPDCRMLQCTVALRMYNALDHPNLDLAGRIFGPANSGVIEKR